MLKRLRQDALSSTLEGRLGHNPKVGVDGRDGNEGSGAGRKRIGIGILIAACTAAMIALDPLPIPHFRMPNAHRDRAFALEFVRSWDDRMFERLTRMGRVDFYPMLATLEPLIAKNAEMARRSSGSPVSPELQLLMTTRILAGASYLDLIWYQVDVNHIWEYIRPVLVAIHQTVSNVQLPYTEEEVQKHISDWAGYMDKKYTGLNVFPGVVGAVDGFVVERFRPTERELDGKDFRSYLNRAGVFAWVAMAVVGVYCQFLMFEIKCPGATNDCSAFEVGEGLRWMHFLEELKLGVLLGDDAFSAIHARLLTPFTKKQLRKARADSMDEYFKMRTFNHLLSCQRITVERAFGILVRRWGCLWKPMERNEADSTLMVIVCVKLHNICVARWKTNNPLKCWPEVPEHIHVPDEINTIDEEVRARLENQFVGAPRRAGQNSIRLSLCNHISSCGVHITREDDFLLEF